MNLPTFFAQAAEYGNDLFEPTTSTEQALNVGAFLFFTLFTVLLFVGLYVFYAVMLGKLFKKAGVKSWKAWVPVYNNWIMLQLGGQQGWWAIVAFVPVANLVAAVFMCIAMYHIGLKLGKEGTFVLLAIFLYVVWLVWLAVDKSTWNDAAGQASLIPVNPPHAPADPSTPIA